MRPCRPLIILCKCSCRLAALACSQLAIIGLHAARVHTHATCARWLKNSPLTITCCASPMPGRCVHACLARLLMSSLSCIPAFSPNVERGSRSRFNFPRNITCNKLMQGISCNASDYHVIHGKSCTTWHSHVLHGNREVLLRDQGIIRTRMRAVSFTSTTTGICSGDCILVIRRRKHLTCRRRH